MENPARCKTNRERVACPLYSRVLVAPCYKRRAHLPTGAEKNGHTARKGGQNLAYRTRTAKLCRFQNAECRIESKVAAPAAPGKEKSSETVLRAFYVRPTRYAHCGESPRGAAMMRNPRPEEQLRGGNKPWERKFEGKSRLYEQELHIRPDGWTRLHRVPKSDTSSRIHKVDADGAGGK